MDIQNELANGWKAAKKKSGSSSCGLGAPKCYISTAVDGAELLKALSNKI